MSTQHPVEDNSSTTCLFRALKGLRTELCLSAYPKTTNRIRQAPYALEAEDLSPKLCMDLDNLLDAMANPYTDFNCYKNAVALSTAMPRMGWLYRVLRYPAEVKKIPTSELSLTDLVKFAPRKTALRQAKSYDEVRLVEQAGIQAAEDTQELLTGTLKWLRKERQISPSTEPGIVEVFLAVAKFLYYKETDSLVAENYGDIPVIVMLRQELQEAKDRAKGLPPVADESLKWLDWPDFIACVHHLKEECQPFYSYGLKRKPTARARSVQRFLVFALLTFMPPDRQRTLRELEVGKTLVKGIFSHNRTFEAKEDGNWYVRLKRKDYKTGKAHGEQWLMVPDILYPYLEDWLNKWRDQFSPNHNFVFTQENGKPFTKASGLSSIIRRATYRLTGKLTTSHLIRHMLITHLKRNGATDEIMRSLAEAMHHSTEMQSQIYDRRHNIEKVSAAQDIVLRLAKGEPVAQLLGQQSLSVEEIIQQIQQLPVAERQRILSTFTQP